MTHFRLLYRDKLRSGIMNRIIRNIGIGIAAIIGLLVALVVIFATVFDANEYKQELSELVREQTGRELQFQGDISLTLFPALGMKLGAMSFSNAAGFGVQPMIRVGEVSIGVDMMSLISFNPEIDRLVLRNLEINLVRNKVGVNNWDDLVQGSAAGSTAGSSAAASTQDPAMEIKGSFAGLDLQNVRLLWLDEQAGSQFRVTDLDITTGRIAPNQAFPLEMHINADSAGEFRLGLDFKADLLYLVEQKELRLDNILLALNEFEVSGRVKLSNFAQPALEFELDSQELDVDALMARTLTVPAAGDSVTVSNSAGTTPQAEDVHIPLPMETLRNLDIDGTIAIAKLKAQNIHMTNVGLSVKASNGKVSLDPLTMNLYGGNANIRVELDARSAMPKYYIRKILEDVQVGNLLRDYAQLDTVSGTLNANVKVTTRGEWVSELKKNSNGQMSLAIFDGALNGFNLRHSIDVAKAKIQLKEPPPATTLATDFSALRVSGVIRRGIFRSDDLDLQAPLLRVGGKGTANLNSSMLDYLVNAKLVGTVEGQQGKKADQLSGLSIPVKIEGPFADPKIDVQLDEMLKAKANAAKAKLKADIARQKAELKEKIKAEKKKLVESKKHELEKKLVIEKAKRDAEFKKQLEKAKQDLLDKLFN